MRKISMMLVGALFMVVHATAQENLKKVEGTGIYTSDNVFVDEKGEYFAKVFYITFHLVAKLQLSNAFPEALASSQLKW